MRSFSSLQRLSLHHGGRRGFYGSHHRLALDHVSSIGCILPSNSQKDDHNHKNHRQQHRSYHTTPRSDFFLYGTILVSVFAGYAAVRAYQGKPLTPDHLVEAKDVYQKMEEDRVRRNQERQPQLSTADDKNKNKKESNPSTDEVENKKK